MAPLAALRLNNRAQRLNAFPWLKTRGFQKLSGPKQDAERLIYEKVRIDTSRCWVTGAPSPGLAEIRVMLKPKI